MTAFDEVAPLDRDRLINAVYDLQATLTMLAEQLAREREPDLNQGMLNTLNCLHGYMQQQQPSLRRH